MNRDDAENELFTHLHAMYRDDLLVALDAECHDCNHAHDVLADRLARRLVGEPPTRPKLRAV